MDFFFSNPLNSERIFMPLEVGVLETYASGFQVFECHQTDIVGYSKAVNYCKDIADTCDKRVTLGVTLCYSIVTNIGMGKPLAE